jgi:predicted phosphodiesterase
VRKTLAKNAPGLLICGHSHILHVETDKKFGQMQYLNPGAAGHQGFHQLRTLLKFRIENGTVDNIRLVELGPRGRTPKVVQD